MEKSKLTDISFARADAVVLTFTCGRIEGGVQHPYDVRDGDEVAARPVHSGCTRWILRDGQPYGILVHGVDGDKLWKPEQYIEQSFYPNRLDELRICENRAGGENLIERTVWKCKPINASDPGMHFVLEYTVTAYLKTALRPNQSYLLAAGALGCECEECLFSFQPEKIKSPAIHTTQIGYRCDDGGKIGYVSYWDGSTGIQYDAIEFQIVHHETNQCVFRGVGTRYEGEDPCKLENGNEITVKAPVWRMDFSALSQPGRYHLYVENIGVSYPFEIGRDVWRHAFSVSMKGFLHHHSGISLDGTLSNYVRPRPYHPDDGKLYFQSTCSLLESGNGLNALGTDASNFGNLVKGCTNTLVANVWGGYFDACDWDRRIQHLYCSNLMFELYMLFPAYFNQLKLAIPESGNDLPDLLNEALFNLDFYRRLQLPDGGIRGGAEAEEHPLSGECAWQDSLKAMVYAPEHWSSYLYAASASFAAQCLAGRPQSALYAQSAEKAARWALKEDERTASMPYTSGARAQILRAKNLMAAHLYNLTGKKEFHDLFEETFEHVSTDAGFAYVRSSREKRGPLVEKIMALLQARADYGIRFSEQTPYHIAVCNPHRNTRGYGHLYSVPDIVNLLRLYFLTGNKQYLDVSVRALNVPNGANPMDLCYTTGIGVKQPNGVLHHDSRRTGQATPDGITVYGNFHFASARQRDVPRNLVESGAMNPRPEEYPSMESYLGIYLYPSQDEYTVTQTISRTAYYWGFLAARA